MLCLLMLSVYWIIFFFKQKTAYEMRISDWSSDVCSSDLDRCPAPHDRAIDGGVEGAGEGVRRHFREPPAGPVEPGALRDQAAVEPVAEVGATVEIGRASCRERVCQYV